MSFGWVTVTGIEFSNKKKGVFQITREVIMELRIMKNILSNSNTIKLSITSGQLFLHKPSPARLYYSCIDSDN